jgi:DNA-binding HxlR family transcriptional regulator
MKGHGQFCPVAVACEVFAHRWTPLILRELLAGSTHFNQIKRGLPLISRTTLTERLRALGEAGVVTCEAGTEGGHSEYRLTPAGRELETVIRSLGEWGQRWTSRVDAQNLDAELLMWNVRRRLATDRLPTARTVVRFDFTGLPSHYRRTRTFWLILERRDVDLCVQDPGDEPGLYVEADLATFARTWLGDVEIAAALRGGAIKLTGTRELKRAFPTWLLLSPFATVPRPVRRVRYGG